MFILFIARARRHIDGFRGVRRDFLDWGGRCVRDLGLLRGSPSLGLGFCFFGRGRFWLVVAEFSEVQFLNWILTKEWSCCDGSEHERITESAHVGDLQLVSDYCSLYSEKGSRCQLMGNGWITRSVLESIEDERDGQR